MKAISLFLFRLVTGGFLIAWSGSKILDTDRAIAFSDTLYMGYASTATLQHGLAALGAVLGIFVVFGFLRNFSYGVQALVLAVGVAALARITIVPPVDLASGIEAAIVLTPGLALFFLALAPLVWRNDDAVALDRFIDWRKSDLAKEAAHAAVLGAPVVAETVHAEHAGADVHIVPEVHASKVDGHKTPVDDHGHEEHVAAEAVPVAAEVVHSEPEPEPHGEVDAHANGHDAHAATAEASDDHGDAHGHGDDHGHAKEHGVDDAHAHDEHKEPQHAH